MRPQTSSNPKIETPPQKSVMWVYVLLAVVTLALYWPVTHHEFVTYDDRKYVTENPEVQAGLTWNGISWAMTANVASNWHPLSLLSHMLDCQLFGLHSGRHHFMNLLLHVINSLLLLFLLQRWTGAVWRSALVAALFAWHPLHVESVAWVAERKDVLSALFWFLTLLAYGEYVRKIRAGDPKKKLYYIFSLILFALGLMSKPMVVTLPFVMLLMDYWPLKRIAERGVRSADLNKERKDASKYWNYGWLVLEKVPFFCLAAIDCVLTVIFQNGVIADLETISLGGRLANSCISYFRYIGKMVAPVKLAVIYPLRDWPAWLAVLCAAGLIGISWLVFRARNSKPYLPVGWFWFLGTLVPVIGLVQVGVQSMADRYSYLPLVGLFVVIVWGTADLAAKFSWPKIATGGLAGAALSFCLVLTTFQLQSWQNSITLFGHAIAVTKDNYIAYSNMAYLLREQGKVDEAVDYCKRAVKIKPKFNLLRFNLAYMLEFHGELEEARHAFEKALELKPDDMIARLHMARILAQENKPDEAIQQFSTALQMEPTNAEAHLNLGQLYAKENRMPEAIEHLKSALELHPNWPPALKDLGQTLAIQGDMAGAAEQYAQWVKQEPKNPEACSQLAMALYAQRKIDEALVHYREALDLAPNSPVPFNNLAYVYATDPDPHVRNGAEAVRLAEKASELTHHDSPVILGTLAAAYAEAGQFSNAIATATQARDLASAQKQHAIAKRNGELLQLYLAGKPFHESKAKAAQAPNAFDSKGQ